MLRGLLPCPMNRVLSVWARDWERAVDLALVAGIHENNVEAMRRLLHCSILEENKVGQDIELAPKGQRVGFLFSFA